jgi:hypothetical protein
VEVAPLRRFDFSKTEVFLNYSIFNRQSSMVLAVSRIPIKISSAKFKAPDDKTPDRDRLLTPAVYMPI